MVFLSRLRDCGREGGKMRVCIDPGHGGKDPGAVNGKRYEKNDTLKLARRVGKVLKANGIEVTYTRTKDVYHSTSKKTIIGNGSKADYFISIHRNASVFKSAHGVETYVYTKSGKQYEMAKKMQKLFEKEGFHNRGVKKNKRFTVLKKTRMPALLIEVGFISNKKDNQLLDSKFNQVADCITRGIVESVGKTFKYVD